MREAVHLSDVVPRLDGGDRPVQRSEVSDQPRPPVRPDATEELTALLRERIVVIDGAMGTAIQRDRLDEAGYRGERFADWPTDLQGNNDLLSLTQPEIIAASTASTSRPAPTSSRPTRSTPTRSRWPTTACEDLAYEINLEAAAAGRGVCRRGVGAPDQPRYVAGALGPTTPTASISPDVNDPGARNVTYDQLVAAYTDAGRGLVDGGADLLMVETIFDTLNAKAAIFAVETLFEDRHGRRWPVIVSGTITDASGRTLSGQITEAFWASVAHVRPLAVGLNCALGATEMRPYIAEMARIADSFVSCYPNAGLPNAFGEYDEAPEETAGGARRVRRGRLRQPRRRLLRHHAGAHRRDRRGRRGHAAARGPERRRRCGSRASSRSRSPRTACSSTSASAPTSPAPRSSAT